MKQDKNECKIISVVNQKGGAAKTTTSICLSDILAGSGKRVLLTDTDPQASASNLLGFKRQTISKDKSQTIYELLCSERAIENGRMPSFEEYKRLLRKKTKDIIKNKYPNFDALISHNDLNGISEKLSKGGGYQLKNILDSVKDEYDYIIIDTPPALSIFSLGALTASDYALIVAQADAQYADGVYQILPTIATVMQNSNTKLRIAGILITIFDVVTNNDREMKKELEKVSDIFDEAKVFNTPIRKNIKIKDSLREQKRLSEYAPKSAGYLDYLNFSKELIDRIQRAGR